MLAKWSDDVLADAPLWPRHAAYLSECDRAFRDLELVGSFQPFSPEAPTVVCVARNEAIKIGAFISHYSALGARSIHIIDNGSSDGTDAIAAAHTNVTLWRTTASYARAAYGQMWVGGLVRRYGLGTWVVNVDADEFLVYSGIEQHSLADLQALLTARGQTRMLTPLIDLYSGPGASNESEAPLLDQSPFFDGPALHVHMPDTVHEVQLQPYPTETGGPRARLMRAIGSTEEICLRKVAVAKWNVSTAYANVHFPFPFGEDPESPQGALLHFKFLRDFPAKVSEALKRGEHWRNSLEYRRYDEWLRSPQRVSLYDAMYSRRYSGPKSLIDAHLMVALDWDAQ